VPVVVAEVGVDPADVEAELTQMFGGELADFELDNYEP